MVSAAKAFAKEPPREPLTSLRAIADDFKWRYVDTKKTDQVIEYCRSAPSLRKAISRAVEARDEGGKHHNHQSKVDITARRTLGTLMSNSPYRQQIRRIATAPRVEGSWVWSRFDALHELIDEIKPYGIGPVTVYDVAVRVGAFLDIEPTSVYMHAGVRQGFKALAGAMSRLPEWDDSLTACDLAKLKRVPMEMFPEPLCDMRADDVEDILCTYREVFEGWGNGATKAR